MVGIPAKNVGTVSSDKKFTPYGIVTVESDSTIRLMKNFQNNFIQGIGNTPLIKLKGCIRNNWV